MPQYLSPGVYVEEVALKSRSISGVGTSTAGFIGVVLDGVNMPAQSGQFKRYRAKADGTIALFQVGNNNKILFFEVDVVTGKPDPTKPTTPDKGQPIEDPSGSPLEDPKGKNFAFEFDAGGKPDLTKPTTDSTKGKPIPILYNLAPADEPQLVTSWEEFKSKFGDFQTGNKTLAHAVYGFFNNGGTRCFVLRVNSNNGLTNLADPLALFESIDEIAIVAVPGAIQGTQHDAIIAHCVKLQDRVAVLDGDDSKDPDRVAEIRPVGRSPQGSYAALYYPWIKVFDPVSNELGKVPPSGHIAGVYARSDAARGVFKAPANEGVIGALDTSRPISKAHQEGLNPEGINAIRVFNGAVKVWGARTLADEETSSQFRYISTRRFFNFLRESIDQGTQFAVFEPNTPNLWQGITQTASGFLLNQWRDGALFGSNPEQAFFVKCDKDTNPDDVRKLGQVVTEIGVAIVKPAEFVIFRIQQLSGG
mgnify:CR=1 FL=1